MICHKGLVTIMLLLFLLVLVSNCLEYNSVFASGELRCKAKERNALLRFKQGLIDEDGILSSWGSEEDKKECCMWKGIECSMEIGHVIGLNISSYDYTPLRGKISNTLLELSYLDTLDLSFNDFGYVQIPKFIGSLKRLQHLGFRESNFSGVIPHELGNLTNIRTLDLGYNNLVFKNISWLSHLSLLSLLDLSNFYLRDANFLQNILNLPSLKELHLSECQIHTSFYVNSSSTTLSILDLFRIGLTSSSFRWILNMSTNLRSIDLSSNDFSVIPDAFGRFTLLEHVDLSQNRLLGGISKLFGNLSHLQTLILSQNNLSEPISELFYKLSVGANESIKILKLDENQFNESFPDNFGQFSRLEHLDLSQNQITGPMPDLSALVSLKELRINNNKLKTPFTSLWKLSKLEILDVSFNSFEGTISDADFSKFQNLKVLDLSYNSLVLNVTTDWIPPFQLDELSLACCKMGPSFPTWLQTQTSVSNLDLSCAGISDEVPKWLWDMSPRMVYLNLSHNQISGTVSNLTSIVDISYNNFSGHLPLFDPNSKILQLNNNMFWGSISSICTITYGNLMVLDLSDNQLSGELPNCWDNMVWLRVLNLNNNTLSGHIPHNLGSLSSLKALHLSDNNFSWELPSTLKNCKELLMINVGGNKLTGNIPAWIGTHLKDLKYLILRHNNFYGSIPQEICNLNNTKVLDLSRNSLSGTIPQCFNNFTSLIDKNDLNNGYIFQYNFVTYFTVETAEFVDHALVQWKGQESQYRRTLGLLKLIDLSSNKLVGNIPNEFSHLRALISLNLSRNYLSGSIVSNIGEMEMLECLDLSRNQLFGEIPIGLAELHLLAVLDLSDNNLSGKIPSSTQLQSFSPLSYAGNSELCGNPLPSCLEDAPSPASKPGYEDQDKTDDGIITRGFFISMAFGFIFGFWGVVGTLVIKRSWRSAYFSFFSRMNDWLYVTTTIYAVRLRGNIRAIVSISN